MDTKCPTCGRDDFSSKKGMRCHHKMSHGESLKKVLSCDFCDDTFEVFPYRVENENKKFCSSECQHNAQKKRKEKVCKNCGSIFETTLSADYECCSWKCRNDNLKNRATSICGWCNEKFEHRKSDDRKFCSVECTENWFSSGERPTSNGTGEDHWAYIDGEDNRWYGPNWKDNRQVARDRVEECEHPDCTIDKNLQCHHIVPIRYFVTENGIDYKSANDTENLMMLCPKHHTMLEHKVFQVEEEGGYETE